MREVATLSKNRNPKPLNKEQLLKDYRIAQESRQASLMGRKEVFMGKAKFGIFGDGKELAQLAMARYFEKGDFRSGYYRDQTLMLALELATPESILAQLYADTYNDPFSKGRQIDYVLGKFSDNDMIDLLPKLDKAIDMILSFCTVGIAPTMNFLNE